MHRTPTGPAVAADAHPGDMKTALLVIHDAIQGRDTISANSIRYLMDIANVKGQVRGPAFARAVAEGSSNRSRRKRQPANPHTANPWSPTAC
jgi:hypothetical protein